MPRKCRTLNMRHQKTQRVWFQRYTAVFSSCFKKWHELVNWVHVIYLNVYWPLFVGSKRLQDYNETYFFTTKQVSLNVIVWSCTLKIYIKQKLVKIQFLLNIYIFLLNIYICIHMYIYIYIYIYMYMHISLSLPGGAIGKEPACRDIRNTGSILGSGRPPGGGHSNPLHYSCLENPIDRGAWWATVYRIAKRLTWLKWLSMHAHSYVFIIANRSCLTLW